MSHSAMCEDETLASLNRQRIAENGNCIWHIRQELMSLGWEFETPKPRYLRIYELPALVAGAIQNNPRV